ncbi:MAG: repressor LexA, partial [Desulfobacterales bacterium]
MQPTLTAKQQRVLDYLQHEITTNGQVPSLRQAAAELGV